MDKISVLYNWSFFHLVFCFASMYMMCVLMGWQIINKNSHGTIQIENTIESVWVQVIASWCSGILYMWTLIAPIYLPNRDFTIN